MLTYYAPTTNDRTSTYWLSTAINYARNAGADQYRTTNDILHENKGALKRLWWCCIIRAKILALGLRRPPHIRLMDFDFT